MRWLGFAELDRLAPELDALVGASPEVDRFCSSSAWILPAREAFAPAAPPLVARLEAGIASFMIVPVVGGGRAGVALESSWLLASPLAGPDPAALVAELFALLRAGPRRPVDVLIVSGVAPGSRALAALEGAARRPTIVVAPPTERRVASLEGGLDAFLARRSPKLRAGLARARRLAATEGLSIERRVDFREGEERELLGRVLAVEARSWKAHDASGMNDAQMQTFYRLMLPRLARRGALRAVLVTRDGRDVAFCFGAVLFGGYRGLQSSYDEAHARLSPGALAHLEMIALLCDEGVTTYDLGSDMDYKRRWGEPGLTTLTVAAVV
jgi:CelD/BcsL family acetyltransferase involved in cellulose biosynthesis